MRGGGQEHHKTPFFHQIDTYQTMSDRISDYSVHAIMMVRASSPA